MTKYIELDKGLFSAVDNKNFDYLNQWKWKSQKGTNTHYAVRKDNKLISMHRVIMKTPGGQETDHIDGDGLNNQEYNLRNCSHSDNQHNSRRRKDNTSGYKGVTWNKERGKWKTQITLKNKSIFIGYFDDVIDAAIAYDVAAVDLFGEYAKTNF